MQAKLTEGFNAAVDVDQAVQGGFGGLDFAQLQTLKQQINGRGLPPPQLVQLPPYTRDGREFMPKRRFVRSEGLPVWEWEAGVPR